MTVAAVRLWGRRIGAVSWDAERELGFFEYDPEFVPSGIQIAPLTMRLSTRVHSFPALSRETFHGLPGLLADVLPDKFGNALIDAWLAAQGRRPESFDPVERLCYTGGRGMGALEFEPALGQRAKQSEALDVAALVDLASAVLTDRAEFVADLQDGDPSTWQNLLRVGTSAGGARAKAVIAWNPDTGEVRSGQLDAPEGFTHWLMKLDGVRGNKDRELEDPQGFGLIEYAYSRMAKACGIEMTECRLLEEGGRSHFVTRRFDRVARPDGDGPAATDKLHLQSLCGLAHLDFNQAGAHSYEQAMQVMSRLGLSKAAIEQQFRRMVFNVLARNQDDHTKNIAFLMDRTGRWSLSPAFDVTFAYNPSGAWTNRHQMTLNGKRDGFELADFEACGRAVALVRGRARAIVDEVRSAVLDWSSHAEQGGVPEAVASELKSHLRTELV